MKKLLHIKGEPGVGDPGLRDRHKLVLHIFRGECQGPWTKPKKGRTLFSYFQMLVPKQSIWLPVDIIKRPFVRWLERTWGGLLPLREPSVTAAMADKKAIGLLTKKESRCSVHMMLLSLVADDIKRTPLIVHTAKRQMLQDRKAFYFFHLRNMFVF